MDEKPACSLCLHRCDARWVGDGKRAFCTRCLVAIGRFVLNTPDRVRFWPSVEQAPARIKPIGEAELERAYTELTGGAVFDEITRAMAMTPGAETHLDLALAYREMGLEGDALEEAARALQQEVKLSRPRALEALTFIPGQQSDALIAGLREALFTN